MIEITDFPLGDGQALPDELAQRLSLWVDRMPGFPHSVQRILTMTQEMDCSPRDLVQVIERDPVVMLKLLKVINSPHYGLPQGTLSITQAVVFLGFNTIKNLALGVAVIGMLPARDAGGFQSDRFLVHSLCVAGIAKRLAALVPSSDPMEYFIAGLLHDFGKMVLAQSVPSRFRRALETSLWEESPLRANLLVTTGLDSAQLCAVLVERWGFPANLVNAIRYQHAPALGNTGLVAALYVANQLAKNLVEGDPLDVPALPEVVEQLLGKDLAAILVELDDLDGILQDARTFAAER